MKRIIGMLAGLLLMTGAFAQEVVEVAVLGQSFSFKPIEGTCYGMGVTEVTQVQYASVMGENPSRFKGADLPVECVSWYDAIYFCNKLSLAAGVAPVYAVDGETDVAKWNYTPHRGQRIGGSISQDEGAVGFRLPAEAEWELAARGGQNFRYAGGDDLDEVGWYLSNSGGKTHPVAQKKANGYGLYDMSGNVWEWCWNPYGNDLRQRYYRGGSWYYGSNYSSMDNRSSNRTYYYAYYGGDFIGFRLLYPMAGS